MTRIGSIYGKRWFNRQILTKYGLPEEERIHHGRWPIVSGDTVQVIEGPEKGKIGQVMAVKRKMNQIVIKEVNLHVRTRKSTMFRAGYFYKTETPIHYTNVQLIDPVHNKPCKVRFGKDANGETVRYSAMSGAILPKPTVQWARDAAPEKRMNKVMDTAPEDVWKVTFKPFTRNWRPEWDFKASGDRLVKEEMLKGKETAYKRYQDTMLHNPIAHI